MNTHLEYIININIVGISKDNHEIMSDCLRNPNFKHRSIEEQRYNEFE